MKPSASQLESSGKPDSDCYHYLKVVRAISAQKAVLNLFCAMTII